MWALADPELNGYVGSAGTVGEAWPHLQQMCRLERQRVVKGKKQVAVSYAISSLPATDADARRLLSLSRGHWGKNRLHWVRDVTFDEDRSQVRKVLAGLRNLVISLVRRAGHSNVAAALRRHNAHLSEAFDIWALPTRQENEKALDPLGPEVPGPGCPGSVCTRSLPRCRKRFPPARSSCGGIRCTTRLSTRGRERKQPLRRRPENPGIRDFAPSAGEIAPDLCVGSIPYSRS